jgi:hypothetical protein
MPTTTTFGSYTLVEYTTADGGFTWTPPTGVTSYDVLVVGGGGSGGNHANAGGGGGAGGLLWLTAQACTPGVGISGSVGAGGGTQASTNTVGNTGTSSVFGSNTALPGAGGGGTGATAPGTSLTHGSGGGGIGGGAGSNFAGGSGTSGQGSAGGTGFGSATTGSRAAGGGGGKGSVGSNAASTVGGNGGTGYDATLLLGTAVGESGWFASGAGGGSRNTVSAAPGTGPIGGGGNGGDGGFGSDVGTAGQANTGGGGGGGGGDGSGPQTSGNAGGSGVVIVRYLTPSPDMSITVPAAATATATAHAPTISFASSFTVAAVAATATALALAPVVTFVDPDDISVVSPAATATAMAHAPTVLFQQHVAVTVPAAATATATAHAPSIVFGVLDITVTAPAATATATAHAPVIFIGNLPVPTHTWNRAGGRSRSGRAFLDYDPPIAAPPTGHTLPDVADIPFAKAYDDITIDADGNSVYHGRQTLYGPMLTVRLVIDGTDVTFWRGARTPIPDWQYTEPFGYGPASFRFEGIGPHEILGEGALEWCRPDAKAKIQLVDHATQTIHSTLWRGQLEDFVEDDNALQVIASGLWSGEASTRWLPNPLYGDSKDIGQLIWRLSESVAGVRMLPTGGPTTGLNNPRLGEMLHIEAVNLLLQRARTRSKGPYTLTPTPWGTNKFRMVEKDTETIDATFYGEGKQVNLQRVRAGEADRIFGRGTTPGGQRVRNGRYPGVLDDPDETIDPPPYPFFDDSPFGVGTTDADTDTGDGVTIMLVRMQTYGLLAREDVEAGTFNEAAAAGVVRLQHMAGVLVAPEFAGDMTTDTWAALYAVGRIGSSVWWSKIEPMAQAGWTRRWNTSADGSILSRHDGFDPDRRIVDKANDYGVWRREQMFDFSDKDLDEQQTPNIFGEVDFSDHGGLLRGSVDPGTVVTDADFMHQLELRPGMNIRFPFTRWGDIVLRFPTFSITGGSSPKVTGRGSTRPVDSLPLYESLNEARAARRNTDKLWWNQNRSSSKVSDVGEFDEIGGQINPVPIEADTYKVFRVLAGQIGMIEKLRIRTSEDESEFVVAIFGLPITAGKLASVCPDPLNDKQGWIDSMDDLNDTHRLLYIAGEPGDPGGYSPGRKSEGHALTGNLFDEAGFAYKTSQPDKFRPWLYVAVYANQDGYVVGGDQGRILWNQELVGL